MFQTTSDGISLKDSKSENPGSSSEPLILPLIQKKPNSRGTHNNQQMKKQNFALPSLKLQLHPQFLQNNLFKNDSAKDNENKRQFTLEVQQKLKQVLGQMKEQFPNEMIQSFDTDGLDFEEKINKNKELIKQHKKRKENEDVNKIKKVQKKMPPKSKPNKNRNESLYEKRAKEYREFSSENKQLQKKKLFLVKEKEKQEEARKEVKSKEKEKQVNKLIRKSASKKIHPRAMSQKPSQPNLGEVNKSLNLFDNIQNYLQNPHDEAKSKQKRDKKQQLVGLSLKYAKRDLIEKIKILEERIGKTDKQKEKQDEEEKQKQIKTKESMKDVGQWRKVEVGQNLIRCESTTFEKEIDRISSLQQKNVESLQKYLEHQKLLVELYYQRQV